MRSDRLWWASFWTPNEDYRPLTDPPNEAVLGWWCTGQTLQPAFSLCLLVVAEDEEGVRAAVAKDWPESVDAEWRFCEERLTADLGTRFPLGSWNCARIEAWRART